MEGVKDRRVVNLIRMHRAQMKDQAGDPDCIFVRILKEIDRDLSKEFGMARDKKKSKGEGVEVTSSQYTRPTKEEYHDEMRGEFKGKDTVAGMTEQEYHDLKGDAARDDANGDVDRTFRDVVEIRQAVIPPYTRGDIEIGLLTNAVSVMSEGPLRDRLERKLADLLDPQQEQGDDTTPEDSWGKDVPPSATF